MDKIVVFRQNGCISAKWLCMGEMVVFGQNDFNLVLIGQSGCNYAKWLYVILARIKPIYKDKILEKSKLVNRPVGGGGGFRDPKHR